MKNLIVAQSGGPSSAINATLAGVCKFAFESGKIDKVYGGLHGISGILEERIIELNSILDKDEKLDTLAMTPAAALGSCRKKLADYKEDDKEYKILIDILRKYNIGYFIYIGGNDSMDTVYKVAKYCKENNIDDIKVMGAPKTIDNDLCETDHSPGFGSAAKYIATTISELGYDGDVYNVPTVNIVEIMGRDAGWLTAASGLARINGHHVPDLIYLCEKPFDINQFVSDVKRKIAEKKTVIVAVSEGVKNSEGRYIAEVGDSKKDAFGHVELAGVGYVLKNVVKREIGCKVRSMELSLMQRCAGHIASKTDIEESKLIGYETAKYATEGGAGKVGIFLRNDKNGYSVEVDFVEISKIANKVKQVPIEWINEEGNDIKQELIDYLYPLIQGELPLKYKGGIPETIVIQ